jgi:hypothetical protein
VSEHNPLLALAAHAADSINGECIADDGEQQFLSGSA